MFDLVRGPVDNTPMYLQRQRMKMERYHLHGLMCSVTVVTVVFIHTMEDDQRLNTLVHEGCKKIVQLCIHQVSVTFHSGPILILPSSCCSRCVHHLHTHLCPPPHLSVALYSLSNGVQFLMVHTLCDGRAAGRMEGGTAYQSSEILLPELTT